MAPPHCILCPQHKQDPAGCHPEPLQASVTCSLPSHQRPELNISAAELLTQELQEITFLEGMAVFLVQSKGLAPSKIQSPFP